MAAIHFQLRNYSESVFFNQQCIRVDQNFAEAYSNLGNALKELGDLKGATQFYSKAIKLKPRFSDAYNNLASAYMLQGRVQQAMETYQMALVLNPNLVDAHTNLGNLYKATGDLEAAKQCYLEAIRINSDFAIAWNNLAGIFKEEGQIQTAVAYYREALRLCPEFADAHSNLGNALKEQHQVQDAIASYQQAIKLRPDFAIAHGNLGSCYYDLGDFTAAIKCFNYAIQLEPNFPDAYNNLGNALKEEGRLDEAINSYRAALHLKPDHPHAYNNLGNAMIEKGFIKEAIHCYVTAIRLMPRFSAAHSNLGSVFKEQGKFDQAVAHYLEAIQIDPNFADAYCNLGNAYKELGNTEEALACYKTALNLEPQYVEALVCLAATLKDSGKLVEAVSHYRKALELRPDCAEALANLVHANVLLCDWRDRDSDMARLAQVVSVQLGLYNGGAANGNISALTNKLHRGVPAVQPFHCLVYPVSLQEMLQIAKKYSAQAKLAVALSDVAPGGYKHVAHVPKSDRDKELLVASLNTNNSSNNNNNNNNDNNGAASNAEHGGGPSMSASFSNVSSNLTISGPGAGASQQQIVANRLATPPLQLHALKNGHRLRIGYVSSDFNHHPLGQLLQDLFRLHDATRFEVFCYATTASDGSATRLALEERVEHFLDVSQWHASEVARHIHDTDRVHVLVNLNGYTKGSKNEIFALKPAPIQVSFLGFCGSMGAADYIQYLVCDTCVVPPHLRSFYAEKTLNLPHSYFANSHATSFTDEELSKVLGHDFRKTRVTRARYGLSDDAFVFCNFNQNYKVDPAVFATWMRILKRVPNSVLWLLRFPAAAETHLRQEARRHGVRDTQLVFSELVSREEHIARGYLADLFLDTPLCNAHTTACDILWAGTPLLTLPGEKMSARVATSLLQALGKEVSSQLVCQSLQEYEERAVQLAEDSDALYALRQRIDNVREAAAIFDSLRWTRNYEHGILMAFKRFELGLSPDHIEVEDVEPVVRATAHDGIQLL